MIPKSSSIICKNEQPKSAATKQINPEKFLDAAFSDSNKDRNAGKKMNSFRNGFDAPLQKGKDM